MNILIKYCAENTVRFIVVGIVFSFFLCFMRPEPRGWKDFFLGLIIYLIFAPLYIFTQGMHP